MEALILVAETDSPTMLARIGIMRALNRHVERVFNPDRKETHWGSGSSRGTNVVARRAARVQPRITGVSIAGSL